MSIGRIDEMKVLKLLQFSGRANCARDFFTPFNQSVNELPLKWIFQLSIIVVFKELRPLYSATMWLIDLLKARVPCSNFFIPLDVNLYCDSSNTVYSRLLLVT